MYRIWNDTERAAIGSWYGLYSATKARSEASETDTQRDQNGALRILEDLRSLVGSRTPNRELRDYVLDLIFLPNGDPKRSEASETDTQRDQNEALRMSERLRSPVGAETPNRELRDDVLDVILLPNGDPLGVHFWPRANFERFLSDFGTT